MYLDPPESSESEPPECICECNCEATICECPVITDCEGMEPEI